MEQLKPLPHPLMALPIDMEEARAFFDHAKREEVRRRLTKGVANSEIDKVNRALEEIAIACYRYKRARQFQLPGVAVDTKWYDDLQEAAAALRALLEDGDAPTVNRLLVALGEEAEFKYDAPPDTQVKTNDELDARQSRLYERGLVILNQQIKLLHWWQGAAEQAADGAPSQIGRPPVKTPLLERSFVHELVDVWCTFHNEPFVAPKVKMKTSWNNVQPDQTGAMFVAVVLEQAGFDFSALDVARIGELVRDERNDEWAIRAADSDYDQKREIRKVSRQIPKVTLRRQRKLLADGD